MSNYADYDVIEPTSGAGAPVPGDEQQYDAARALVAMRSVDGSLAVAMQRAELENQIETARKFPRIPSVVQKRIYELATLDEHTAAECIYSLKRSDKKIVGPSVRFAEILRAGTGNVRVGSRVVHIDRTEKFVEAEGLFHDVEHNTATLMRTRRRIVDKHGRIYNDDMIFTTSNAAMAIALRNATLSGVPSPLWRKAYQAVIKVIAGDEKTIGQRRELIMREFRERWGKQVGEVLSAIGVRALDDVSVDHIVELRGMLSALKNEEATLEEMFADAREKVPVPSASSSASPMREEAAPATRRGRKAKDAPGEVAPVGVEIKGDTLKGEFAHDPDTGELAAGTTIEMSGDPLPVEAAVQDGGTKMMGRSGERSEAVVRDAAAEPQGTSHSAKSAPEGAPPPTAAKSDPTGSQSPALSDVQQEMLDNFAEDLLSCGNQAAVFEMTERWTDSLSKHGLMKAARPVREARMNAIKTAAGGA